MKGYGKSTSKRLEIQTEPLFDQQQDLRKLIWLNISASTGVEACTGFFSEWHDHSAPLETACSRVCCLALWLENGHASLLVDIDVEVQISAFHRHRRISGSKRIAQSLVSFCFPPMILSEQVRLLRPASVILLIKTSNFCSNQTVQLDVTVPICVLLPGPTSWRQSKLTSTVATASTALFSLLNLENCSSR